MTVPATQATDRSYKSADRFPWVAARLLWDTDGTTLANHSAKASTLQSTHLRAEPHGIYAGQCCIMPVGGVDLNHNPQVRGSSP